MDLWLGLKKLVLGVYNSYSTYCFVQSHKAQHRQYTYKYRKCKLKLEYVYQILPYNTYVPAVFHIYNSRKLFGSTDLLSNLSWPIEFWPRKVGGEPEKAPNRRPSCDANLHSPSLYQLHSQKISREKEFSVSTSVEESEILIYFGSRRTVLLTLNYRSPS